MDKENVTEEFNPTVTEFELSPEALEEISNGRGTEAEEKRFKAPFLKSVRVKAATYTNSPLVQYTRLSPNCNAPRNMPIDRITIHCVVGQCTMASLGNVFAPVSRQASSNYGVCIDGIALFVPESARSWCSSSPANDHRAITIETASDTFHPFAVRNDVYNNLIKLCADICKRNGKTKLLWLGSESAALNYKPKSNEMVMTAHRWFAGTMCPGDYLYTRLGDIAKKVTALLNVKYPETPFKVRVLVADLNIRKEATTDSAVVGTAAQTDYTITKVKGEWGQTSKGWLYIANPDWVKIGDHIMDKSPFTDVKTTDKYYKNIKKCYDAGLVNGYADGTFKPNAAITRADVCNILAKLLKLLGK